MKDPFALNQLYALNEALLPWFMRLKVPWIVVFAAVCVLAGTGKAQQETYGQPFKPAIAAQKMAVQSVEVPELHNHTLQEANTMLANSQLRLSSAQKCPPEARCIVVVQSPAAGTRVRLGTEVVVRIQVSTPTPPAGPVEVVVPQLLKLPEERAQALLAKFGLSGVVTHAPSQEASGFVVKQDPVAGTRVAPRTKVLIAISTADVATVPDLRRQTRENALAMLQTARLEPAAITDTPSDEQAGLVLEQTIAPGTQVKPGTQVGFQVTTEIARRLEVTPAKSVEVLPGDSVTFTARLEPPFPGAEFQFDFGDNSPPTDWSTSGVATRAYAEDGTFPAKVTARWNDKVVETPVSVEVHPLDIEVTLRVPQEARAGKAVMLVAVTDPPKTDAVFTFDFGDGSQPLQWRGRQVSHSYAQARQYYPSVTATITDPSGHQHKIPSPQVMLTITPAPPLWPWAVGVATLAAATYSLRKKIWPRPEIRVVKDLGKQQVTSSARALDFEINVVRSWGEQSIRRGSPLRASAGRHV